MMKGRKAVVGVFDIGKTNKKLFLFDEEYKIVFELSQEFSEVTDEDGDPCESIQNIEIFILNAFKELKKKREFLVKAFNFSTYGASFVLLGENGEPIAPLYNYLKPFPEELKKEFYDTYGGEERVAVATASPVLGNLNSGMQLYRIKKNKPELYQNIRYALHLPQFVSYLIGKEQASDITSIGCHTNMWDFEKNQYHSWIHQEGIDEILAPIKPSDTVVEVNDPLGNYKVGIGLHDSSSALIPYLTSFTQPFILISTGTWCITLNPFNDVPLTAEELQYDCLTYLSFEGKPVKASRLFAGNEHEIQVKRLAEHFHTSKDHFKNVSYDQTIIDHLKAANQDMEKSNSKIQLIDISFKTRNIRDFVSYEEAYHQLIMDIIQAQIISTQLVFTGNEVDTIFVDGGFGHNEIYMQLLADSFPEKTVYAASVAQASAIGAALAIHSEWNSKPIPENLIKLTPYSALKHA